MINPTYIDVRIRFEVNEDLIWFLKQSDWGHGSNLTPNGLELAIGYYLNMCREHVDSDDDKDCYCCGMDSGCIYVRINKEDAT